MDKKIKILLFASGGIILSAAVAFLWYSHSHQEAALEKRVMAEKCDPSSGNCSQKEAAASSTSENKESGARSGARAEEKKALPESGSKNSADPSDEIEEKSNENIKKFDSDEDEDEETDDGVTVEVEMDDE
jgi:hypothetical protein